MAVSMIPSKLLVCVIHFLFQKWDIMSVNKASSKGEKWFPLESNPTALNQYINKLGFDTSHYEWIDVFSTESWALNMIPQPVAAVVMLYPLTDVQTEHARTEETIKNANDVWFIKQRISNACGTIGLLHALMNAPEPMKEVAILSDSWLKSFANVCPASLSPSEKAVLLEGDSIIRTLHDEATTSESNQTPRGNLQDKLNTHFVALVHVNGDLYELDGRKDGPVKHHCGTTQESLLLDACKVVKKFMERDPNEMRFTVMALAPKVQQD